MLRSWKLIYLVTASLAALAALLVAVPKILSETIPYIRNEALPYIWSDPVTTTPSAAPPPTRLPSVTPESAPTTTEVTCIRVFLNITGIKEPGRIIVSIQDVQDGLLDKMVRCNGDLAS